MSDPSIEVGERQNITLDGLFGALKFALPLLGGLVALVAIPAALSSWLGLDFDSVFWICAGVALAALTLIRPWWFWYHPKAMLVRSLLTDTGAIVVYLSLSLLAIVAGGWRQSAIASARNSCIDALAQATTTHERFQILYHDGATSLPHSSSVPKSITCERLLEHK